MTFAIISSLTSFCFAFLSPRTVLISVFCACAICDRTLSLFVFNLSGRFARIFGEIVFPSLNCSWATLLKFFVARAIAFWAVFAFCVASACASRIASKLFLFRLLLLCHHCDDTMLLQATKCVITFLFLLLILSPTSFSSVSFFSDAIAAIVWLVYSFCPTC